MFKELTKSTRESELQVASYWETIDILNRSINERDEDNPYVFYDGPATANGSPGIHHVIARTLKDMTCRYKTMKGYQVKRKAGWDTHGLPVEIEVEKQLGITDKKQIEEYGIEAFNHKCRDSVFSYLEQWTEMSKRMAFLADLDNPYVTLENDYIESEWYLLKDFFDRQLVYKGHKILPYCPRCGTGLASHEVAQGYQEEDVVTVVAKFPIKGKEKEYFLAWTTTPWTLLTNTVLTVHPDVTYVKVRQGDSTYILAKELMSSVLKEDFGEVEIIEEYKGSDLEYIEYDQLLPFVEIPGKAFFVTVDDYVTTSDGTGIVHSSPAFGEDDLRVGRKYGVAVVNPVGDDGAYTEGPYKGTFVMDADPEIIQYLRENDKLYSKQKMTHNYPHCWRCDSPLIYYSKPSWYIDVTKFQDKLIENNKEVNWFPSFTGEKRFGNWLENLQDWAISRSRYWGTPLNVWTCDECGDHTAVGSRAELVERAVEEIDESIELHRPYVDDVHLTCSCGGTMTREPDVIDVWFDSGAMPFAQVHYPFENKDNFGDLFPADFICEGIDQTRGWFYSLMAISTLYTGESSYKNVLVNDLILDKNGQKMSKSKGNTLDPIQLFDDYGADAVRFYSLHVSPPWVPTRFDVDGLKEVNSKFFRTIKNVYAMFALYANTNKIEVKDIDIPVQDRPEIDRWLISRYESLVDLYHREMDIFEYTKVVRAISDFVVEDLSNWYIRRNRRRFWSSENNQDTLSVFATTYEVLLGIAKLVAPVTPFLAEELYLALTDKEQMDSVHLELIAPANTENIDEALEEKMDLVRKVVNLGRASREDANIKVRQPLSKIIVDEKFKDTIDDLVDLIKEELNVKDVEFSDQMADLMNINLKPNYKEVGKILGSKIKDFAKYLQNVDAHQFMDELNQKEELTVELQGEATTITPAYVEASYQAKEGYDVAMDEGISVILDTNLDQDLIDEGYMREFISKVQQQRKTNGYEVSDRIEITYHTEQELKDALGKHQDSIAKETLALKMDFNEEVEGEEVDINGHPLVFSLKVADYHA